MHRPAVTRALTFGVSVWNEAGEEAESRGAAAALVYPDAGLPSGWRSLPGTGLDCMFQNVHTGEKISWRPRHPAAREVGASRDITGRVGADAPGGGGLGAAEANAGPAAEHNAAALSQRSKRRAFAQELVRQRKPATTRVFHVAAGMVSAREPSGAAGLMSDQLRQQKAREQSELAERIEKVQREKSWLADDNTAFTQQTSVDETA